MRVVHCLILAFYIWVGSILPSFAWSSGGHMVIAAEAYKELSNDLKVKATDILKAHPDYAKWQQTYEKEDARSLDFGNYLLMRASTWPDEIRRASGKGSRHYDHPHWHYVDYPLMPPKFPMEQRPTPNDDVIFGLEYCLKIVSNPKADAEERAVYLSYLIHLIGDIHQPLHCASLFTPEYPKGDKGGNDFYVAPASRGIKLHSFWDGLLGTSKNMKTALNYGTAIEAKFPRKTLPELTAHKTPKEWSLESRELAIDRAYVKGELKGGTRADSPSPLSEGYAKGAKAVAERQAALAGYRLADVIKKCLK